MSVQDMIQRAKDRFFIARDSDKRELQRVSLENERQRLEKERQEIDKIRKLQADVSQENEKIKQLKNQGTRNVISKLGGGGGGVMNRLKSVEKNVSQFGGQKSQNVFGTSGSPFATTPVKKEEATPPSKGKTITIKLSE